VSEVACYEAADSGVRRELMEGTITHSLEQAARTTDRGLTFVDEEGKATTVSYRELVRLAQATAAALQADGLKVGDSVALILPDAQDFIVTFYGAMFAGVVPVPLYPPIGLGKIGGYLQASKHVVRAARWQGWKTGSEPLLWTLHLGYFWFIAMFALRAVAELTKLVPREAWVHAFTLGALGLTMTGLMTRVVLRHTGRPLVVSAAMRAAYWIALAAALLRLAYSIHDLGDWALVASALAWSAAFVIYLARYGAMLVRPSLPRVPR